VIVGAFWFAYTSNGGRVRRGMTEVLTTSCQSQRREQEKK
jgi:hypothetical protein